MVQKITSVQNPLVKELVSLWKTSVHRTTLEFLVEGEHIILEANAAKVLKSLWILEKNWLKTDQTQFIGVKIYLISESVSKKITKMTTPSGWYGVCTSSKKPALDLGLGSNVLLLDNIQDPGNLGTLIRSAATFGFQTIVSSENSVSYYNDKTIRATQGLFFKLNLVTADLKTVILQLKQKNYLVLGTYLHNDLPSDFIETLNYSQNQRHALLLGNEGQGISPALLSLIEKNVKVRMILTFESLNVAIAGSIIMYFLFVNGQNPKKHAIEK